MDRTTGRKRASTIAAALAVFSNPATGEMVLSGMPEAWPPARVVYMNDSPPFPECGGLDDRVAEQSCVARHMNEGTQLPQTRKDWLREEAMPHPSRPTSDPARTSADPSRPTADPSRTTPLPR